MGDLTWQLLVCHFSGLTLTDYRNTFNTFNVFNKYVCTYILCQPGQVVDKLC